MRLTRLGASKRAKKGWVTKRRNDPTRYGKVERNKGMTYWKRPSGQKIRLEGFSNHDLRQIHPALVQTDQLLKKNVNPDVKKIQKFKPGLLNPKRHYLGGYTVPPGIGSIDIGSPKIILREKEVRSPAAPGILAHEIGHSVFPGSKRMKKKTLNDFKEAFKYEVDASVRQVRDPKTKKSVGIPTEGEDLWKFQPTHDNPLRSNLVRTRKGNVIHQQAKTRQSVDAAEDFAETFRLETGLPIANTRYFNDLYIDRSRQRFMKKHYIR